VVKNPENGRVVGTMLTTPDVARIFNVHSATVRRWCKQGKIKSCRGLRGARLFKREDIAVAYLDRSIHHYLKSI
jgi:excisionase family DNA binding protein